MGAKARFAGDVELPPESSFGHLVRNIHRSQGRLLQARLAEDGISFGCWYFLRVLWTEDMVTQRELSLKAGVNEATTRTAVDRMEMEKLVNRLNDPTDRRKRFIRLTERARQLKPGLIGFAESLNNQILDVLPQSRRRGFLVELGKIHDHIKILASDIKRPEAIDKIS